MTDRLQLEETGFEALQRLYVHACRDSSQAGTIARFLLCLYSGQRFAFDLTELRSLDNTVFEDCLAVLRMDARVNAREVHTYFADGSRKFERLAHAWGLGEQPMDDRQQSAGREKIVLVDGDDVQVKRVTVGDAPGYRDIPVVLGFGVDGKVRVDVNLDKDEAVMLMKHIPHVNGFAWEEGRRPRDAREAEVRPGWLQNRRPQ